jgi:hypothetical protein
VVTTTTTTIVAAPITVAGTIAPVNSTVNNNTVNNNTANTVNNNTVNNIAPGLAPGVAPVVPAGAATALDICVNLPGGQPSVPVGHVLTFALNGALVCVTPATARILHPAAVSYRVASSAKLIFAKKGGLLCVGRGKSSAKKLILPSATSAGKVLTLAGNGKLVCLRP